MDYKGKSVEVPREAGNQQRNAFSILRFLARGERDLREGAVIPDSEVDRHFRAKLEALKSGDAASRLLPSSPKGGIR